MLAKGDGSRCGERMGLEGNSGHVRRKDPERTPGLYLGRSTGWRQRRAGVPGRAYPDGGAGLGGRAVPFGACQRDLCLAMRRKCDCHFSFYRNTLAGDILLILKLLS